MRSNDFSALPVVAEDDKIVGIITMEQVLQSIQHVELFPKDLIVLAVMHNRPKIFRFDEEIPEILDALSEAPCVLIADQDNKLVGIVTAWDTSEYYRQRSEDLMYIRDIESALKEHINAAFSHENGVLDEMKLSDAISRIASAHQSTFAKEVLHRYFSLDSNLPKKPDGQIIDKILDNFRQDARTKRLDELTLNEFIDLLFFEDVWKHYAQTFTIPKDNIKKMLDSVRKMRNDLAHFNRDELTREERDQLRYCSSFFQESHPPGEYSIQSQEENEDAASPNLEVRSADVPIEEEINPRESRYAKLALYLQGINPNTQNVSLTFSNIETIIEAELPESARKHRTWWANDSVSHIQSQQWLDAGWRVASVNMTSEKVKFSKNKDREDSYIRFFSRFLEKLKQTDFQTRDTNPLGVNWIAVAGIPREDPAHITAYVVSFSRGNRFKVDFYIDVGDETKNKAIFDKLYEQRAKIETQIDEKLSWERLNSKRASRIAVYRDGHINDEEKHEELMNWGIDLLNQFDKVLTSLASETIRAVL